MYLGFRNPFKSIQRSAIGQDLPDFVVLVGPNGSGKSHLLQAIFNGAVVVDDLKDGSQGDRSEIKLIEPYQLVPTSGSGEKNPINFRDVWGQIKPMVESIARSYGFPNVDSFASNAEIFTDVVSVNLKLPKVTVEAIQASAGKLLPFFTEKDYRDHFPLYQSVADLFQYSVTEVFLTYYMRWSTNKYHRWLDVSEGLFEEEWLTDEDFNRRYGRPPWEVLDEVLEVMGLTYRFIKPVHPPLNVPYESKLLAVDTGVEVGVDALSSGERVLLALALGLYAGEYMGDAVPKPRLLLLDEADASLHPSMIRSLLYVAESILHEQHGVKIMLATHSSTTVALAPESALYSMSRTGQQRLQKVTREQALAQLTVGVPTLSVRVENRRQVFVESEKDQAYFDLMYRAVKSHLDAPYTLEFIASGKGGAGSCDAVVNLVQQLRSKGNNSILGIVDRDKRKSAPEFVYFMDERYSIENFTLDPLVLGAFLLRSKFRSTEQLRLPSHVKYFQIGEAYAQDVVDAVGMELWGSGEAGEVPRRSVGYVGGFSVDVPERFLETQGHSLENHMKDAILELRGCKDLQFDVCNLVIQELPELLPRAVFELFSSLAEGDGASPSGSWSRSK